MAMRENGALHLLGNSRKTVATNIVILGNAFVWYSYAYSNLATAVENASLMDEFLTVFGIHFLGVFVSVIVGEFVSRKIQRRLPFLSCWMIAGALSSLVPLVTGVSTYGGVLLFSVIISVNFGFGIPICLGYFAESTQPANRGRLGGFTFLLIGVGAFLISRLSSENALLVMLVLAMWKAAGVITLRALKPDEKPINQKPNLSYRTIFSNRAFLLYFIPWTMFLLVNSLVFPVNEKQFSPDLVRFSSAIEFAVGGVSAVIFGFLADSTGRKRLAVAGFTLLGLGHGVLSLSSGSMFGWWFYTFVDGIAWGIFAMTFLFALWGDLADGRSSEKYYAIGVLPYLVSTFIRFSLGNFIANAIADYTMIFSYSSFFLFLAVLPLIYAPETLSEKIMKARELKNYIEKAQKEVAKAQNKEDESKQCENKDEEELVEFKVNQEEDDEKARQLAEKYY